MSRLIDADNLKNVLSNSERWIVKRDDFVNVGFSSDQVMFTIDKQPTVEAVPTSAYEQVVWERDLAIKQLNDIGKGLGEKMDDVARVVRCKDCIHWKNEDGICWCEINSKMDLSGNWNMFLENDFCSYGERKTDVSP